jgi:hypothetical protein
MRAQSRNEQLNSKFYQISEKKKEDSINKLFSEVSTNTLDQKVKKVETTHTNILPDNYNHSNNKLNQVLNFFGYKLGAVEIEKIENFSSNIDEDINSL